MALKAPSAVVPVPKLINFINQVENSHMNNSFTVKSYKNVQSEFFKTKNDSGIEHLACRKQYWD